MSQYSESSVNDSPCFAFHVLFHIKSATQDSTEHMHLSLFPLVLLVLSLFKLPTNSSSVIGRGVPGQGLQVECWRWDRPICTSDLSNTLVHFNTAKTKKFWISWIGRCFFCCVFMLHNVVRLSNQVYFKSFNLVRERQPLAMAVSEVNKLEDRCEKILRDLDAPLAFKAWHALYHVKFSRKISAKKKV